MTNFDSLIAECEHKVEINDQNEDDLAPDTKLMETEQSAVIIEKAKNIDEKYVEEDETE